MMLSSFNTVVSETAREEFLASILTGQCNRLLTMGYPAILGRRTRVGHYLAEVDTLWPLISGLTMRDGYHPFIIVDPRPNLSRQFLGLQHLLKSRGVCGISLTNRVFNGSGSQIDRTKPYLLADVDAGLSLCNLHHVEARHAIRSRGRMPLTLLEGTFLFLNEMRSWKAVGCLASKEAPAFIVFPKSGQGTVYPSCSHILQ